MNFRSRLHAALDLARHELLAARNSEGHWTGELSSSALSTATAVCALATVGRHSDQLRRFQPLIDGGLEWLTRHMNPDGGWGDTILSHSNISTTTLCWAAFGAAAGGHEAGAVASGRAEDWLRRHAGGIEPDTLANAIIARYGEDRTFSVPILTMCAIAGRLGAGQQAWQRVLQLPFELAACPHQWFATIGLPVVSYALPALIAIGQARHFHLPTRNPVFRLIRNLAHRRTSRLLGGIQPESGGFLEATPLTSFVVMSLAASGQVNHPVVKKGVEFLIHSARPDGSWPIDTNLATWVTTLAVNALAQDPSFELPPEERRVIQNWLLGQQYRSEHAYTHAKPGGWAWTDLSGGVPDADDTAGALLALRHLGELNEEIRRSAQLGVQWLLDLQNRDGGIPTFCRGWGKLPFDRSSPDLTAHALRAWSAWQSELPPPLQQRVRNGLLRGADYLAASQRENGWVPLWFGNQLAPDETNLTYGNARVLEAISGTAPLLTSKLDLHLERAVRWLLDAQTSEGAWDGSWDGSPSVEETALAVGALAGLLGKSPALIHRQADIQDAVMKGAMWLTARVQNGGWTQPSPIGFYFAKLWYYERLYPMIFTVGALGQVSRI